MMEMKSLLYALIGYVAGSFVGNIALYKIVEAWRRTHALGTFGTLIRWFFWIALLAGGLVAAVLFLTEVAVVGVVAGYATALMTLLKQERAAKEQKAKSKKRK